MSKERKKLNPEQEAINELVEFAKKVIDHLKKDNNLTEKEIADIELTVEHLQVESFYFLTAAATNWQIAELKRRKNERPGRDGYTKDVEASLETYYYSQPKLLHVHYGKKFRELFEKFNSIKATLKDSLTNEHLRQNHSLYSVIIKPLKEYIETEEIEKDLWVFSLSYLRAPTDLTSTENNSHTVDSRSNRLQFTVVLTEAKANELIEKVKKMPFIPLYILFSIYGGAITLQPRREYPKRKNDNISINGEDGREVLEI